MDTTAGQKKVLRMAKERENISNDIYQSKVIKDEEERVLVDDLKVLERCREYYQKLMHEENPIDLECAASRSGGCHYYRDH